MSDLYDTGIDEYNRNHQGHVAKPQLPTKGSNRRLKIYWIGLGSKTDGLHTKKDFLDLMRKQYPENVYYRRKGDKEIPDGQIKKYDIESWMHFAGAKWV
jgi:hypothetical protein